MRLISIYKTSLEGNTDSELYLALPDVVNALDLSPEPETPLDDLPEYMHMVALVSHGQAFQFKQG